MISDPYAAPQLKQYRFEPPGEVAASSNLPE
jgi:hypothetical protein